MSTEDDKTIENDLPFEGFKERLFNLLEVAGLKPRESFKKVCETLDLDRKNLYNWFSMVAPPIMAVRTLMLDIIAKLQLPWDVNVCLAYLYFGAKQDISPDLLSRSSSFGEPLMISEVMRCTLFIARTASADGYDVSGLTDQQLVDIFERIKIYCETRKISFQMIIERPPLDFQLLVKNQLKLADMKAL